jgi:hypothetical protein
MDQQGRDALMIARGFKSVIWVATVGTAALGCYMVSLRVATERNELAKVERQILEARRDIRSLQTELGTRGRMTQLEQWNAEVLALSAPSSQQFLKDEFTLARLYRNDPTVAERSAEVRLASAEAPAAPSAEPAKPQTSVVRTVAQPADPAAPLVHRASFTPAEPAAKPRPAPVRPDQPAAERTAAASIARQAPTPDRPAARPVKPERQRTAAAAPAKPDAAATRNSPKPTPSAVAAKPATKPATMAARSEVKPAATAAKPAAKPATIVAKPVREAAAAVRPARVKGTGGN